MNSPTILNDLQELQAANEVFRYLESLRDKRWGITGYTSSSARPPAFGGNWWSSRKRKWLRDDIIVCVIDYKIEFQELG